MQSITYRLADSLPAEALSRMERELLLVSQKRKEVARRNRLDALLDAGHGCCVLSDPKAVAYVVNAWRHFAGERYDLIAWVVMPNHVHVLIRVYEGFALGKIVQSWKSFTGRRIKEFIKKEDGRAGARPSQPVWMREYWDRFVRDEPHFHAIVDYIHNNPVKARLVENPEAWPWSSAREFEAVEGLWP